MQAKINKYPYFLWLNQPVTASFDFKNKEILIKKEVEGQVPYRVTKSSINKISKLEIFLMKHLIAFIYLIYIFYIPGIEPIALGLCVTVLGTLIVTYFPKFFKKYILLLCMGGLYLVYLDQELLFENSLYVTMQLTLLFFLLREVYSLIQDDEYYCINEIDINDNINTKAKLNISNLSFGGYYLRVKKWELEDEK